VKNLQLEQLLEEKGQNKPEIWRKIIEDKGSVRNIDFLTDEEKKIFKTGYELDMKELIIQAADRQKYICQSQSLNLFLKSPISGKQLNDVHVLAHELGVKSLYYLRSESVIEADSVDNTAVRRQVSVGEECSVCQ
jgi:ribonucleoside-diphosphate reductase alpha chain